MFAEQMLNNHTDTYTQMRGERFMKYAAAMGADAMMYIPRIIPTGKKKPSP
jgi:hypothetical protein